MTKQGRSQAQNNWRVARNEAQPLPDLHELDVVGAANLENPMPVTIKQGKVNWSIIHMYL